MDVSLRCAGSPDSHSSRYAHDFRRKPGRPHTVLSCKKNRIPCQSPHCLLRAGLPAKVDFFEKIAEFAPNFMVKPRSASHRTGNFPRLLRAFSSPKTGYARRTKHRIPQESQCKKTTSARRSLIPNRSINNCSFDTFSAFSHRSCGRPLYPAPAPSCPPTQAATVSLSRPKLMIN